MSIKKWPSRTETLQSFRFWAHNQCLRRQDISRIGCFGSLANGTWGVGSDIDIIVLLADSKTSPLRRAIEWDTTTLPVAADVIVLTEREAEGKVSERFKHVLESETTWVETIEGRCI